MIADFERQAIVDEEHLKLLSLGYWTFGGFTALYALLLPLYFGFIGSIFIAAPKGGSDAPPAFLGWLILAGGAAMFLLVGAFAALQIGVGFWVRAHRHRVVTYVVAALLCPSIPFGTLLGVSTFVVLSRPTVKALYEPPAAASVPNEVPPASGALDT